MTDLLNLLEKQRQSFVADGPPGVAVRRHRIDRLMAMVLDNTDAFVDAMAADFGTRSRSASLATELVGMVPVIEHTRSHIRQWMRAGKLMRAARLVGLHAEVQPSPLGVVGIIGPWNFPLQLVVLPAAAAFAAGNRVMIKMSEITSRTAELMHRLAPEHFADDELAVVTGGADVAAEFARLPFDHLFFTGSPSVGALVQRAAAGNLVPVTLELGGQEPRRGGPRRRHRTIGGPDRLGPDGQRRAGMRLPGLRAGARPRRPGIRRRCPADAGRHVSDHPDQRRLLLQRQ